MLRKFDKIKKYYIVKKTKKLNMETELTLLELNIPTSTLWFWILVLIVVCIIALVIGRKIGFETLDSKASAILDKLAKPKIIFAASPAIETAELLKLMPKNSQLQAVITTAILPKIIYWDIASRVKIDINQSINNLDAYIDLLPTEIEIKEVTDKCLDDLILPYLKTTLAECTTLDSNLLVCNCYRFVEDTFDTSPDQAVASSIDAAYKKLANMLYAKSLENKSREVELSICSFIGKLLETNTDRTFEHLDEKQIRTIYERIMHCLKVEHQILMDRTCSTVDFIIVKGICEKFKEKFKI